MLVNRCRLKSTFKPFTVLDLVDFFENDMSIFFLMLKSVEMC